MRWKYGSKGVHVCKELSKELIDSCRVKENNGTVLLESWGRVQYGMALMNNTV